MRSRTKLGYGEYHLLLSIKFPIPHEPSQVSSGHCALPTVETVTFVGDRVSVMYLQMSSL